MFPFQTLDQIELKIKESDNHEWLGVVTTYLIDTDIGVEAEVRLLTCIAHNPHTPQYILAMLADHHEVCVRCAVAGNSNTNYGTLVKLVFDHEKDVQDIIRAHYGIPLA